VKPSKLFYALLATIALLHTAAATAESIDMNDPRRAVGREDDVRIDAQLVQDTVSPGTPIGLTYQIENFSASPVALADKVITASYDADTSTITVSIGSETPQDKMPHLVTIAPGEKKLLRAGVTPVLSLSAARATFSAPRYVQVRVSILRDLAPFAKLAAAQSIPDELFDKWFESNDTISLNAVPVRFSARRNVTGFVSAEEHGAGDR
jgi:hypothetical protein